VEEYLATKSRDSSHVFVIMREAIMEFEYGWIFPYQTTKSLKTRDPMHLLGGNGPIIVNKLDGTIFIMGTGRNLNIKSMSILS
jgi:hypothetical protein